MWHYRQEKRIKWHIREKHGRNSEKTEEQQIQPSHTINVCTQRVLFNFISLFCSCSLSSALSVWYDSHCFLLFIFSPAVAVVAIFFSLIIFFSAFFFISFYYPLQLSVVFKCILFLHFSVRLHVHRAHICKAIVIAVQHGTYVERVVCYENI